MILTDTDLICALAKVGTVQLLFALFQTTKVYITPGVFKELEYSFNLGRDYAKDLLALMTTGHIEVVYLTPGEAAFRDTLPPTLGTGERESIAVAKRRKATVLSNESRVAHYCREYGISCVRLPDILRGFWVEGVASKEEVRAIVKELEVKDRMRFRKETLNAIFVKQSR